MVWQNLRGTWYTANSFTIRITDWIVMQISRYILRENKLKSWRGSPSDSLLRGTTCIIKCPSRCSGALTATSPKPFNLKWRPEELLRWSILLNTFVRFSVKKTDHPCVYQLGEIFPDILSDFLSDHHLYSFRLLLDLLENASYFWYTHFNFHACLSFLFNVRVKIPMKEKCLFSTLI